MESMRSNIHSLSICAMPNTCFVLGIGNIKMCEPSSLLLKRMHGHEELCMSPMSTEMELQKQHPRLILI